MQLTPHFTFDELTRTNHSDLLKQNQEAAKKEMGRLYYLAGFAEAIRDIIGQPMVITSGYRCEELNKRVGGAVYSTHKLFEAIDFVPNNISIEDAFIAIMYSNLEYGKLILEKTKTSKWIHASLGGNRDNLVYKDGRYITVHSIRDLQTLIK